MNLCYCLAIQSFPPTTKHPLLILLEELDDHVGFLFEIMSTESWAFWPKDEVESTTHQLIVRGVWKEVQYESRQENHEVESETVMLRLVHDPREQNGDKPQTYNQDYPFLSDGVPGQLIKLLRNAKPIMFKNMRCKTATEKVRILSSMVLSGKAKDHFSQGYRDKGTKAG